MIRSRQIAADLGLQMKIGDVEYQGDGNKAIFYYIADERVDFRQLIKVLAEAFRVRIEMKQIGARQEAGRIGGIGPCGRELCCATWMTNFVSVSTSAARYQDISLNPQKLAGQCAKLKCCLNYEVDAYVECQKRLPSKELTLETLNGTYYYFKADILKGTITYSTDKSFLANEATITAKRAFEIINMNRRGEKPEKLEDIFRQDNARPKDLLEQESLTRFDKSKNSKNKKKKKAEAAPIEKSGNKPATQPVKEAQADKPKENRTRDNQPKEKNRPPQPKSNKNKDDVTIKAAEKQETAGESTEEKTQRPVRNNRNRNNRRPKNNNRNQDKEKNNSGQNTTGVSEQGNTNHEE